MKLGGHAQRSRVLRDENWWQEVKDSAMPPKMGKITQNDDFRD